MDFVPMRVVEHLGFGKFIANENCHINSVFADSITRELKEMGLEVDEYHINILQGIPHMATTTDVVMMGPCCWVNQPAILFKMLTY